MFGPSRHPRPPIGLDIGTRRIKAVQLDKAGGRIMAASVIPRTESVSIPSPAEVGRIVATLDRAGFVGNQIVLSVPPEKLIAEVLEFPRAAGAFEQLARMEIARGHRCAPDAIELGVWELPASGRSKSAHVMAVACRHEDAAPLLDVFEQQQMDVVALDVRSSVLARAAGPLLIEEKGVTAIVDFGWSAATLVLIHQRTVFYERKILEAGLGRLHRELCQRLRIEADVADYVLEQVGLDTAPENASPEARALILAHLESLTTELHASFNYASHQYEDAPLGRLMLSGGGTAVPGVADYFTKNAGGATVRTLAPTDLFPAPKTRLQGCQSPALLPALGLAMYPMTQGAAQEFAPKVA